MLDCTGCRAPLSPEALAAGEDAKCGWCAARLEVSVFPALFRPVFAGQTGEAVLSDTESACFYHPGKRAVIPCEACGRFLCALCDVDFHGQHFCPSCLDLARSKGRLTRLENQRTRYDRIAMALAIYPMLFFFYPTLFTAPVTLVLALRHWKTPASLVYRTKIRSLLAIVLATGQIVCWVLLVVFIVSQWKAGK